jgi:hypothetical protein
MPRPGTTITRSETRPVRSAPTSVGPWFIAGLTGTADADLAVGGPRKKVINLTQYATRCGDRASHSNPAMYDAAEFYFKEGGAELYVSRQASGGVDAAARAVTLKAATDLFTRDLGPGQISSPDVTEAASQLVLMQHANANNRLALIDAADSATAATVITGTTIAGAVKADERVSAMFGPKLTVPGTTIGTTRSISPLSVVAGLMAHNDGLGITPNQPAAGIYGISAEAIDAKYAYTDADRVTLNVNGANVLRLMFDGVRVYGYRTLTDPTADPNWINLANARFFMAIQARLDAVAERFLFRQIDGGKLVLDEFAGALTAELLPFWRLGSLGQHGRDHRER